MMEGFAGAKVLVEALRRAGGNPTRDRLLAALNNLHKYDIGGMEVIDGARRVSKQDAISRHHDLVVCSQARFWNTFPTPANCCST